MKLLSLNTHSWVQTQDPSAYAALIADIIESDYDAIALQEVNQLSVNEAVIQPLGYVATQADIPIKENNFAYFLVKALAEKNVHYNWSWVPCHLGYDIYDEGVAVLCKQPIQSVQHIQLSNENDFTSILTRFAMVVETATETLVSIHLSWWKNEGENPFLQEWNRLEEGLSKQMESKRPIFILGDVNNPADVRDEGYDFIIDSKWFDAYQAADVKSGSATVPPAIDGWADNEVPLRIDYVFSNHDYEVEKYEIKFDGDNLPLVSDHYGVAVIYK
ncbi:endonuclease/exonuclease/phosphatase family protein [Jeotgalibaca porci]|uniref:endonuclease/exonuclease/phosphatase family protein n=1 Tax=Jeotgalibaca porci TaxID=1868793 RepID=UPI0035A10AA5